MAKYKRPLTDILAEITAEIPSLIKVLSVEANGNNTQTLSACDILYAQEGFNVTISGRSYKITAVDYDLNTITVKPNFKTGTTTILADTYFNLYEVFFYHGTPVTTQTEIEKIKNADQFTPMVWIWENYKEKTLFDSLIERKINGLQLFGLTQPPLNIQQMTHDNISEKCVRPMRRMMELFEERLRYRTDLFYTEELEVLFEDYPKFGIMARNKGATTAVFLANMSGVGAEVNLDLMFKDECPCSKLTTPTYRTLTNGNTRTLTNGQPRTIN